DVLLARAAEPVPERWDLLLECARRGLEPPGIHPYFAARLFEVSSLKSQRGRPRRFAVDSCAGEFEARTPYYYVTHEGDDEGPPPPSTEVASRRSPVTWRRSGARLRRPRRRSR